MIFRPRKLHIQIRCRNQESLVRRRRRNGTRIHQRDRGNLTALQLGTFTVREIPRRVADRKRIVRRSIPRAKARPAERRLHNRSRLHQVRDRTILHQLHINRGTRRIYAECKFIRSDIMPTDDVRRRADILKSASGTSCNDSLLHI